MPPNFCIQTHAFSNESADTALVNNRASLKNKSAFILSVLLISATNSLSNLLIKVEKRFQVSPVTHKKRV